MTSRSAAHRRGRCGRATTATEQRFPSEARNARRRFGSAGDRLRGAAAQRWTAKSVGVSGASISAPSSGAVSWIVWLWPGRGTSSARGRCRCHSMMSTSPSTAVTVQPFAHRAHVRREHLAAGCSVRRCGSCRRRSVGGVGDRRRPRDDAPHPVGAAASGLVTAPRGVDRVDDLAGGQVGARGSGVVAS